MPETLRGIPIKDDWVWVIVRLSWSEDFWFPLEHTAAMTRQGAIDRFCTNGFTRRDYSRLRKRGEVRALRCRLQPCTFGEDRRKGVADV